jgi:hypothetical protein
MTDSCTGGFAKHLCTPTSMAGEPALTTPESYLLITGRWLLITVFQVTPEERSRAKFFCRFDIQV